MIRSYIGLPPLLPPPTLRPYPPFPLMPRGCIAKASLMFTKFTNVSQKYRRSFTDVSLTISANNQQLSPNVRRTLDYVGDALVNIRQTIASQFFSSELLVFYAQNRKASGSIGCIIIHFTITDAKIPNGIKALHDSKNHTNNTPTHPATEVKCVSAILNVPSCH